MKKELAFQTLESYLARIPAVVQPFGNGVEDDGSWWIKFAIDIDNPLAWHAVQELGHVLNYLSINERLPTSFVPVSPPPYMNGGPKDFLSWVIECSDKDFKSGTVAKWLEERLPKPVDDLTLWNVDS
jgi:hypothetical protein